MGTDEEESSRIPPRDEEWGFRAEGILSSPAHIFRADTSGDEQEELQDRIPSHQTTKRDAKHTGNGFLSPTASHRSHQAQCTWALYSSILFILVIGLAVTAAFLVVGISSAVDAQNVQFERSALDLINKISGSWKDYEHATLVIHNRCRDRNFTRAQFRDLYEYLIAEGLQFQAAQFEPNITHAERVAAEQEAREYFAQNYKHIDYQGIVGFNVGNETSPQPRWDAPFYFPIHYMEPIIGNERAIDLDYHSSGSRQKAVLFCMYNGKPGLTDRLRLVQETDEDSYGMVLIHPGINLTSQYDVWPRDLASIVIRIPELIARGAINQKESSQAYLYDLQNFIGTPQFLGGMQIDEHEGGEAALTQLPEVELDELLATSSRHLSKEITVANKRLVAVVVASPGTFEAD